MRTVGRCAGLLLLALWATVVTPGAARAAEGKPEGGSKSVKSPPGILPTGRQVRQAALLMKKQLQRRQAELERQRQRLELLRQEIAARLEELESKKKAKPAAVSGTPGSAVPAQPVAVAKPADPLAGPEGRQRLQQMAKGLSGMSPPQAAETLANLPEELAVRLLLEMDDRKAGKVLGALKPEKAAALVAAVLRRADRRSQSGRGDK